MWAVHSNLFFTLAVWIGAAIQACICAAILARKLHRQWPSILTYCVLAVGFDIAIALNHGSYRRYFYLYWAWCYVAALIRLWVLADVMSSFPGADFIGPKIRYCIAAFAAAVAIGAVLITVRDSANYASAIVRTSYILDRCVALAWGMFLVTVLGVIGLIGLGWHRTGALVANALIVKTAGSVIFSYLLSFSGTNGRACGAYSLSLLSIASLLIWLWALGTHREELYTLNISPTTEQFRKDGTTCT